MTKIFQVRRARPSEEGYILVAVVFMTAILVLSLAVALPRVRESIQRDREIETMHRGKQYIRAIQLYYKKFNSYPPNIDALIKTNNIRFLRKKYVDPTTGKEEWKPIMYGQNKTPVAMGFFGQPLAISSLAGIGPSGGNLNQGSPIGVGGGTGQTGGGLFNSTPTTGGSTDAGTGATNPAGAGGTAPPAGATGGTAPGGTDPTGNPATGGTDSNGNPIPGGTGAGGAGASGASSSGAAGSTSAFGGPGTSGGSTNGQTFGGGGIIGFSPQSPKQSILIYKKKNHYNEWEFLYSPAQDQQTLGGGNTGAIGQPASNTTTPVGTQPFAPTTPATTPQQ
jgi:type II secretory pathway pseudopilin PulG